MRLINKSKYLLVLPLLFSTCSCQVVIDNSESVSDNKMDIIKYGSNYRKELEKPNQDNIFGMDYLSLEWFGGGVDYVKVLKTLSNMGVKSIRNWMHFQYFMEDPDTFIEKNVSLMHDILRVASEYNIQVVGMSHTNWSIKNSRFVGGKPRYQTFEGSDYQKWLDMYEKCWYNLVSEFPEIEYWEIDNEINNKDFMYIEEDKDYLMSSKEMAKVAADILYRGSKGIHDANPNAITVLGGLVDPMGLGIPMPTTNITMVGFLNDLYDEIESGEHGSFYPDDFFQTAAWHPYYYTTTADDYFWNENNKIYEVIKNREGKDKKVFLTEFGWSEAWNSPETISTFITDLFTGIKEKMPYVESVHYYRLFDNSIQGDGDFAGMFYDPSTMHNPDIKDGVTRPRGGPKPYAYTYQQLSGGSGSLRLLEGESTD